LIDHKDHEFEFTTVVARDAREKAKAKLQPLVDTASQLERSSEEIMDEVKELEQQGEAVKAETSAHFQNLRVILDEREQALLTEVDRMVGKKRVSLVQQEKLLCNAASEINNFVSQVNESLENSSNAEIVTKHAELLEEIENTSNPKQLIYTVEEVHIVSRLNCADALQELCKNNATIGLVQVDPSQCEVMLGDANQVEVGKMQEATVTLKFANGFLCRSPCKVSCQLTCVRTSTEIACKVVQVERSRHVVQFTAVQRGRHKLAVSVNGVHIAGSPFSIFAVVNPRKLGEPVMVMDGFKQVTGITINSKGNVVLAEEKGDIVIFEVQKNKILARIQPAQHKVKSAYSVAVDDNDTLYCGDYSSNKIFTSDCDGRNCKIKDVPLRLKVPGRRGIALAGDKLLVCEKDRVVVYKKGHLRICWRNSR